ncbi:peptide-binding protein [Halobellus salinus]|uniref:Peptide-binding protein n=1 Tax=Halobellus salinus TaxID=931585 RepID=A0A830EMP7_9EURY|nr:ABC transporter substrate-binding protein [Halobellus salinus]GGI98974.1 peptide-binding protein [Halobellus salinus]SMP05404.1 peptide/nickel transport system substrate-binding protein [Halobellus salinus]
MRPGRHTIGAAGGPSITRRQWLTGLGMGATAGLAGCSADDDSGTEATDDGDGTGSEPDGTPSVSGTYDTVIPSSFSTLNPLYNTGSRAGTAIGRTLDPGYTFNTDGEYFPLLYDLSTDDGGSVWVFDIREGLSFTDPYGQVDASTFVYQIRELHQTDWAATAASADWTGITVEETGEFQFQAELPEPRLLWPESYDPLLYPVPTDIVDPYVADEDVEGLRQEEALLDLSFTGNLGGYTLEEWERGAGTTYSRNDEYYLRDIGEGPELFSNAPYFEGASIDVVEERASRLAALETGEADSAGIPPERFSEFEQNPRVSTYRIPQPFNRILSVNMRDNGWNAGPGNLFRHTAFRQGLAAAIGKEELIAGIFRGLAQPHYTWQPSWSEWHPGDDAVTQLGTGDRYGGEVARGLVGDAIADSEFGYRFDGNALVTPEGETITLDLYHLAGGETSQLIAEFIGEELSDSLGIEVTIEAIDAVRFQQDYWTAAPQGGTDTVDGEAVSWDRPTPNNPGPRSVTSAESWDMSIVYGLNTYPLNPLTNAAFFDGADARYNPVGYYPEFDATGVFERARSADSEAALQEPFTELFQNLAEEQPYVMLAFGDELSGYTPDLVGPTEDFFNGWDFPAWYFDA